MFEKQAIEIAPLAYMRGRTLNHAFVILDEAQNTTPEQMKMFLTRIGFGSKAVITGDITQIDLQHHQKSGLVEAMKFSAMCAASRSRASPVPTSCAIRWWRALSTRMNPNNPAPSLQSKLHRALHRNLLRKMPQKNKLTLSVQYADVRLK
jgi:hypothetical protein